jgi:hypothetical protein
MQQSPAQVASTLRRRKRAALVPQPLLEQAFALVGAQEMVQEGIPPWDFRSTQNSSVAFKLCLTENPR